MRTLVYERRKLASVLEQYYRGLLNTNPQALKELNRPPMQLKYMKNEVDKAIERDLEIIELQHKIEQSEDTINLIKSILNQINVRGYQLRAVVEYQKLLRIGE